MSDAAASAPSAPAGGDAPGTVDVDVSELDAANDTETKPGAKPSLTERLAASEAANQRKRAQKQQMAAKTRELQAERDRLAKEHETSSGELAKMKAAVARFAEDGDEEALREAGLPEDLYDRLTVNRMQPEATKAQREAGKKEREYAQRIEALEAERKAEKEAEKQAAATWEKQNLLRMIRDDEAMDDLHVYDDDRLIKWAGQEAKKLRDATGQKSVPFADIMKALHARVAPHHAKVVELHQKREAKKAEGAKAGKPDAKKPVVDDEPSGVTGSLAGDRGGASPKKAMTNEELRKSAMNKLRDLVK